MESQAGGLLSNENWDSGERAEEPPDHDSPLFSEVEPQLPPELRSKLDVLWQEFEAVVHPTVSQMDEFLSRFLSLPPEAFSWSDVFHRFARLNHPDLLGVFRRIATEVPHTDVTGMGFFYWAAAEVFTRQGTPHLLPNVAAGIRRLDIDSYDPDAVTHVEEILLTAGFEAETLQVAEHFLTIERADDGLMPYAVPGRCNLIFELRVGRALREGSSVNTSVDTFMKQLRLNIEEEVHEDSARLAAEIALGRRSDEKWERSQFELVTGDISEDETAWLDCLRLYGTLIRVAREYWLLEARPPGCTFRGLTCLLTSVYNWRANRDRKKKALSSNLLDYLRPGGLESRIVQSCREIMGVNVPRALLILQAYELLANSAARHQLITPAECAQTNKEVSRLRDVLDDGDSEVKPEVKQ